MTSLIQLGQQGCRAGSGLIAAVCLALLPVSAAPLPTGSVSHGVSAALINVVQNDTANTASSVSVTTALSVNGFSIRPGSNRGDVNVQAGAGFSDDVDSGVLMSCVAQNGRDNGEANYSGTNFCTTSIDYTETGNYKGAFFIPVFNAPAGAEFNIDVAAAHFPFATWIGGYARNSGGTNGGANNHFTGSPGLASGIHYIDQGNGISKVNLKSIGIDSRTDGVLLVTHGSNEDNFALSEVNALDGSWNVYVKDNGSDGVAYEQDPVAFVFVPKTNTTVISGRFKGDGKPLLYSGTFPAFAITNTGVGRWRLSIPGQSPGTGVLIISAEGGVAENIDNIVSYKPDGTGWIIESRDLPASGSPGLQTPSGPVASFVFIPAAPKLTLLSPAHRAVDQPISPALLTSVTNALTDLTYRFYGRELQVAGPDFAIALLPDTQFYTGRLNGGLPEMFYAQTEWVISNRVSRNIAYVAQLGDITQNGDLKSGTNNITEWSNATNAMYRLEDPTRTSLADGIPYGVAVGNHDQEPIGSAAGTSIYYNQYFGVSHFDGRSYYAGHYGTNNDNHVDFFSASGLDFMVLYFEYDTAPDAEVLAWGNNLLQTHSDRRAIVVTHNLGNTETPVSFSAQGAALYNAFKTNANLFMMLAGHVTGEGSRVDTFNGNLVRTFVQDFQGWANGGNGFMRTMDFSPKDNQVVVQTFSPWTGEYETDANSEFFFTYDMQPTNAPPFALIGTSSNVPPGSSASVVWTNLKAATTYEWYVEVTDSLNNLSGSEVWRFTTASNLPPVATNQTVTLIGDEPAELAFSASDPDGDSLAFSTNSHPVQGLIFNLNPAAGTFTYLPAHGFRGLDQVQFRAHDGVYESQLATLTLNVLPPVDADTNGLPDSWENKYGVQNPNADADNDGQTNLEEFLANTNPTNATSYLRITHVSRAENGYVTLGWPSIGGTRYRVEYNSGDIGTGSFTEILRPPNLEIDATPNDATSTRSFVDDFTLTTGSPTNSPRYYRIKVVQ